MLSNCSLATLATLPPSITELSVSLKPFCFLLFDISVAEIIILFSIEGLFSKTFENSTKKLSFSILILFYCGFMITLLSYIAFIPQYATYYLVLFFIQVFMTDSFAWFFGVLFGKNNRGLFAASPNKSIVGFIGGIFGSIVCSLILKY